MPLSTTVSRFAVTFLALAGLWCARAALKSWRTYSHSRTPLDLLDALRFSLCAAGALGIAAINAIAALTGQAMPSLRLVIALLLVLTALYFAMLATQVKLGYGTKRPHGRPK